MADFKVGDEVICVDARGTCLRHGQRYNISSITSAAVTVESVTGGFYAERFKLIAAMGYVGEFTVIDAQPSRTPDIDIDIDIESRLMAAWLAVPANCCRACSAPLPCAYHPAGR